QKNNLVQQKKFYSDTTFYGKNYLHIYEPIYFQAIKYGTIYLRISTHSVDERINEQIKTMALLLLGLIIISILISNYFQNIISHPIIKLSNFAVKISKSKNITERINYDAKDEIGDLYTSFNIMLNQIEKREKENKQARVNLRENQRQLVEIIDAIPQFIYIKDINNKFLLVNKKLSAFFKIPANEIIGRKQKDLKAWLTFKLDSNDDLIKVIEKNESIFIPEVEINDMWGNLLYLQITKLPFIYNGSMALLGVGVDVTDVIKGEKALRESQELFSVFMDRMPAATFIKNSKSEYLYVNEYLKKNFDAHNWINTRKVINSKGESKRMEIEDEKALKQATSFEEKLIDKHGNIRHYETWKFPIKREDKAPLIGGISVENTKKKRAEQRIIFYIEELKRNNQELAEFNYVASHDLKEPLRTLTSYCELLEEDVGDKLNDEAKEDLDFITNAAARMNALIQDLLELSRAGRVELKNQKADLNQCLNIAITDLDHFIKKKEAIIDKGKLPQVWGDKIHLTRIFQNLIHNAIKFNDSKQPIV
ncbi:MAG: PAS domain S-box protein, partial [Bacteroidales bacterium]|nr:PAS domain S-box protein [Bacteroidales bacterium]